MAELRIRGERLLADIASLAEIGGTGAGGVSRPAYGDEDIRARAVVRDLMRNAGLEPRVDAAGNTFA